MKKLLALFLAASSMAFGQNSQGHQVILQGQNVQCKNDTSCNSIQGVKVNVCTCNFYVYRASCANASSCPAPSTPIGPPYSKLPGSPALIVGANGTQATYTDNDNTLTNATVWVYTMTSQWTDQTTSQSGESGPAAATTPVTIPGGATLKHQALLNYFSAACTTSQNCWLQVYRAICSLANGACPSFTTNANAFTSLVNNPAVTYPVWNTTDTGTVWQVVDADPALADGTTYVYVATTCWAGTCPAYSQGSAPWNGTTTGTPAKNKEKQ